MGYRVPVLEKFSWQEPVLAILKGSSFEEALGLPEGQTYVPVKGQRYIIDHSATDNLATLTINGEQKDVRGMIVWYAGPDNPKDSERFGWQCDKPSEGWKTYVIAEKCDYHYDVKVIPATEDESEHTEEMWSNKARMSGLILDGDVDSTSTAVSWLLKDGEENSLSFVVGDKDGDKILTFNTVKSTEDDAENDTTTDKDRKAIFGDNVDVHINGHLFVKGETTHVNSTNLEVEDKVITVAKGATEDLSRSSGVVFGSEEAPTAFIKTTPLEDNPGFDLKAPGSNLTVSLELDNRTDDATSKLTENAIILLTDLLNQRVVDEDGNVTEQDNKFVIDQGLSTTNNVKFANLDLTGYAKIADTLDVTGATTLGNDLTAKGSIKLAGNDDDGYTAVIKAGEDGFNFNLTGDANISSTLDVDDNKIKISKDAIEVQNTTVFKDQEGNHVTVKEMYESFNNRAKYDCMLGCIVFDEKNITRVDCNDNNDPYPPQSGPEQGSGEQQNPGDEEQDETPSSISFSARNLVDGKLPVDADNATASLEIQVTQDATFDSSANIAIAAKNGDATLTATVESATFDNNVLTLSLTDMEAIEYTVTIPAEAFSLNDVKSTEFTIDFTGEIPTA